MQGVFNPNILIYHPPNSAEGLHFSAFHSNIYNFFIINPRRATAERVTVVVSCVCMYVCLSAHAILEVRAIRSITKDARELSVRFAAILKWRFS